MSGVFTLVLHHKGNELLSIHRNIKSQDDLKVYYEPKIRSNRKKLRCKGKENNVENKIFKGR
jgi:hypothetical protein